MKKAALHLLTNVDRVVKYPGTEPTIVTDGYLFKTESWPDRQLFAARATAINRDGERRQLNLWGVYDAATGLAIGKKGKTRTEALANAITRITKEGAENMDAYLNRRMLERATKILRGTS